MSATYATQVKELTKAHGKAVAAIGVTYRTNHKALMATKVAGNTAADEALAKAIAALKPGKDFASDVKALTKANAKDRLTVGLKYREDHKAMLAAKVAAETAEDEKLAAAIAALATS